MASVTLFALALLVVAGSEDLEAASDHLVPLATFNGNEATTRQWETVNDPVMGGQSASFLVPRPEKDIGVWVGEVREVPFLKAAGFCNLETPGLDKKAVFPDLSECGGLIVRAREAQSDGLTRFNVHIETEGALKMYKFEDSKDEEVPYSEQGVYTANITMTDLMRDIKVPWKDFKCQYHGETVHWCPNISTQLSQVTNLGLGTVFPGELASFSVEVESISGFLDKEPTSADNKTADNKDTFVSVLVEKGNARHLRVEPTVSCLFAGCLAVVSIAGLAFASARSRWRTLHLPERLLG
eukprot:gnl/TRDRNA2_/TRDRNA2_66351_c0_seq1.p1 gnl/TRDRNA2_/TRDRNA2_66351_c0~~gnl/TRDRNA2_/TRDRNA2_66351_c0_seq1.p1  ORF type:complete len:297 (-),score=68.67 gnl/TRDRNA2_/TRDRNA2_66351_c0_seq1:250-1140(-)